MYYNTVYNGVYIRRRVVCAPSVIVYITINIQCSRLLSCTCWMQREEEKQYILIIIIPQFFKQPTMSTGNTNCNIITAYSLTGDFYIFWVQTIRNRRERKKEYLSNKKEEEKR